MTNPKCILVNHDHIYEYRKLKSGQIITEFIAH